MASFKSQSAKDDIKFFEHLYEVEKGITFATDMSLISMEHPKNAYLNSLPVTGLLLSTANIPEKDIENNNKVQLL